jgi:hypothetical protein
MVVRLGEVRIKVSRCYPPSVGASEFVPGSPERACLGVLGGGLLHHAESLIRGDVPLTRERFDPDAVAKCVNLRFAYGTASHPIFEQIASHLAAIPCEKADAIDGLGHLAFYQLDAVTTYIRNWT